MATQTTAAVASRSGNAALSSMKKSMPLPRRRLRALIILMYVYTRLMFVSRFLLKTFYGNINGYPPLRDRPYQLPTAPAHLLRRLKWLYLRKVWAKKEHPRLEDDFTKTISAIEQHAAANYPEQTEAHPLPEYDWKNHPDPEEFYQRYIKSPMPCVLRGFGQQIEATKHWSFDYILEKCGDVDVRLFRGTHEWTGKLREIRDPEVYCQNEDTPFRACPELADDLGIPLLAPYIKKRNTFNQMFIGQKGTGSPYHCASVWNFFLMVEGSKKWTFVDPELTWMMYPEINAGIIAFVSLLTRLDTANLDRYELYQRCPRYWTTLEPGDVLLNPPWWWHTIDNLTPTSIGVATRWDAFRSDDSFYQLNRALSIIGMINPYFPRWLYQLLVADADKGQEVVKQGAGALDEGVRIPTKSESSSVSYTMGERITAKLQAGKKW